MPTLLVIDDEPAICRCLEVAFSSADLVVVPAGTGREGTDKFQQLSPAVVLLDLHLPDGFGLNVFRDLHRLDPRVPIIIMTGAGTTETAIEAMSLGAFEYVLKPLDLDNLRQLVLRAGRVYQAMCVPAVPTDIPLAEARGDALLGRCPAMQEVYKAIGRVAAQDVTVLIVGESGTGKELVARSIYQHSRRARAPFLAINCAAIPETLLESELFGHERGAFTGAENRRIGKFEQCTGGTLFLDEIGDMSPLTQVKILRVLQDQQFERVGANETIRTDVRVIAATNHDLAALVRQGRFRQDLFYRLNGYLISLPPLRGRGGDLPLLVAHFLRRFSDELGKVVRSAVPETLAILQRHSWPGNVRELQSVLRQSILQCTGPLLVPDFLPATLLQMDTESAPAALGRNLEHFVKESLAAGTRTLYADWLRRAEREMLVLVLRHTKENLSKAARVLGIHRKTLRAKLELLQISPFNASAVSRD